MDGFPDERLELGPAALDLVALPLWRQAGEPRVISCVRADLDEPVRRHAADLVGRQGPMRLDARSPADRPIEHGYREPIALVRRSGSQHRPDRHGRRRNAPRSSRRPTFAASHRSSGAEDPPERMGPGRPARAHPTRTRGPGRWPARRGTSWPAHQRARGAAEPPWRGRHSRRRRSGRRSLPGSGHRSWPRASQRRSSGACDARGRRGARRGGRV